MEINQIIDEEEVVEAEKQPDQYVHSNNRKRVKPPTEKKKDSYEFKRVRDTLQSLFESYSENMSNIDPIATTTLLTPRGYHGSSSVQCKDVLFEDFDKCEEECSSTRLSELQLYFNEQKLDRKKGIDILSFWKGEQYRYPILSCLARDVLSIPISTVASESAFSIGGRVLDQYRSSLLPETVQVVICTRDWIYGKKIVDDCGADMGEATEDVFNNDTY